MSLSFVLAAGGTGGHLFPAEALASELLDRGIACAPDGSPADRVRPCERLPNWLSALCKRVSCWVD